MAFKKTILCLLLLVGLLWVSLSANSINPWASDPLANINFDQAKSYAKQNCESLDFCPICDVVEEWPLDFDGDDLAEIAQHRICTLNTDYKVRPEAIIIYSSARQPIVYKTNLDSCKNEVLYTEFKRHDFNRDNLDELLVVEKDLKNKDEAVSILGFDFAKQQIVELPIIDYHPDLEDQLIQNEILESTKESFNKINGRDGFIIKAQTNLKRSFHVYYYQDSLDRKFYPLRVQLNPNSKRQRRYASKAR